MKVRVTLKDPDIMHDAVADAAKRLPKPDGVEPEEWADIVEGRAADTRAAIEGEWMPYGEYLTVEFDTETQTATVIPAKEFK